MKKIIILILLLMVPHLWAKTNSFSFFAKDGKWICKTTPPRVWNGHSLHEQDIGMWDDTYVEYLMDTNSLSWRSNNPTNSTGYYYPNADMQVPTTSEQPQWISFTNNSTYRTNGMYNFDGSDDRIPLPNFLPNNCASLTLNVWFKLESYHSPIGRQIVAKWEDVSSNDRCFSLDVYPNKDLYLLMSCDGGGSLGGTLSAVGKINLNTWYMATWTLDGKNMSLYLNGVLEQASTNALGYIYSQANTTMCIGSCGNFASSPAFTFDGWIDITIFAARPYTATEILQMYNDEIFAHQEVSR